MRLKKESRVEVERLSREDPEWWPGVLEHIAGGGRLEEVVSERAWSWGALWGWIQADDGRVEEMMMVSMSLSGLEISVSTSLISSNYSEQKCSNKE